jgi:uncharacterized BrkB/YihY/UPF0761 family membrane protein
MKRIERLLGAIDRFQQRHSVLGFPFGVVKKYGDDQGGRHAALLAHYGFLSLFPLLLVFITVLGYTLDGDPELQEQLIETLADQFPVAGAQIEGSIRAIQGSGLALAVGVAGTLWGGLGITQSFQDAMNDVWNIPRRQRPSFWWRLARGLAALLLIFQILTGMAVRWRWLVPGAAVGALGWSVLQTVGVSIVNRQLEQANLVYGVFAVVIVLLGWLYLSSQLVLYAAEINVVLARRLWPRSLLQAPLTEPDRRVLTALARNEERRPEQRVQVSFLPEDAGADAQPPADRDRR